jgi:hypothetical protein
LHHASGAVRRCALSSAAISSRSCGRTPGWSASRGLRRFWFRSTLLARAQALVHAPAALRRRGVFVADYEIDAA